MGSRRAFMLVALTVVSCAVQAAMTSARAEEAKTNKPAQATPDKPAQAAPDKGMSEKGVKGNAFGTKNWKPMPPKKIVKQKQMVAPPVVAAPPPPPSAPPLPFTYIGRMVDGEATTVFLSNQQRNLAVKVGDTIDNVYRVENIADSSMTLTYIPLNTQQQLSLGGPK